MPEAGVLEAREDLRPARAWIDFGVDGSWEPAPARSRDAAPRARRPLVHVPSETPAESRAQRPAPRRAFASGGDARASRPGAFREARTSRPGASRGGEARTSRPGASRGVDGRTSQPGASRAQALPAIQPVAPTRAGAPRGQTLPPIRPVAPARAGAALPAARERRTVQIRGRGAEGYAWREDAARSRRRPAASGHTDRRRGPSPDRMALWAVLLGLVLVLVAATSSNAATLAHRIAARPAVAAADAHVTLERRPDARAFSADRG